MTDNTGREKAAAAFLGLYDTVARLRAPDGCPWDREQSPRSLRGDLMEECYECIEAIDDKEPGHIREELGDLFLLVTMLSYMHEESGAFSVAGALEGITEKLIRRHPHVFGDVKVRDSAEVLDNWARIKVEQEGRKPKDSVLDGVSTALPVLERAHKLQKKAAAAGFDFPDIRGAMDKFEEEYAELRAALAAAVTDQPGLPFGEAAATGGGAAASGGGAAASGAGMAASGMAVPAERDVAVTGSAGMAAPTGLGGGGAAGAADAARAERIEEELGDLLFSALNLSRFLAVDPAAALQRSSAKFVRRFKYVERAMKQAGREMNRDSLPDMDRLWDEAKARAAGFGPRTGAD